MSNENQKKNPILFQENFRGNGELKSIYQYIDNKKDKNKFLIPKWCFITGTICCASILITLIASLAVVYYAPRAGLHEESCLRRSCLKSLSLKCINSTCVCDTGYIYIDKCILKKNYLEKCHLTSYCKDNTSMVCMDGVCKCSDLKYWNGNACTNKLSYNKTCASDDQCLTQSMLYCDTKTGKCTCDNTTRYVLFGIKV
jgi:hypothetical protein